MMNKRLLMISVILVVFLSAVSTSARDIDWRAYKGTQINVQLAQQPWADFIKGEIKEFEALTGIRVNLSILPEDQHRQRLAVSFASGRGDVDVFASQKHNEGVRYLMSGWYEPLEPFLNNPLLTPKDFDFEDFASLTITDATVEGVLVGIPLYSEVQIVYYNKALFAKAGINVPDTLEELKNAAILLTDRKKGVYGITLRGRGAAATTIFSGFLHSMGGSWADSDRNPMLNTPEAIKAFEFYAELIQLAGPPGSVNNHWFQCQSLMASGKAALWIDSNIFAATLLESDLANDIGFAVFPEGPGGRKPAGGGWYLSIAPSSKKQKAAWYFIQWALNKENVLKAQLNGIPTARVSAWEAPQFKELDRTPELTKATLETLQLEGTPSWGPPWVAVGEIRDVIGEAIVTAIQGGDIRSVADSVVERIQIIRDNTEKDLQ
ncbi:MAG: sugar ABC transporter substrate-binding protein [Peptococcaceae bacterium]|nr:sugar ABC transporter substrate-binding protein [Peptococcaceae bacterium]